MYTKWDSADTRVNVHSSSPRAQVVFLLVGAATAEGRGSSGKKGVALILLRDFPDSSVGVMSEWSRVPSADNELSKTRESLYIIHPEKWDLCLS